MSDVSLPRRLDFLNFPATRIAIEPAPRIEIHRGQNLFAAPVQVRSIASERAQHSATIFPSIRLITSMKSAAAFSVGGSSNGFDAKH